MIDPATPHFAALHARTLCVVRRSLRAVRDELEVAPSLVDGSDMAALRRELGGAIGELRRELDEGLVDGWVKRAVALALPFEIESVEPSRRADLSISATIDVECAGVIDMFESPLSVDDKMGSTDISLRSARRMPTANAEG